MAIDQENHSQETIEKVRKFVDYVATQLDAIIMYRKSDMILAIHNEASYLSEPGARSRMGGHFFTSSDYSISSDNRAVLNIAQLIKAVMTSAAEAAIGLSISIHEKWYQQEKH